MSEAAKVTLWQTMVFRDADAMMTWLSAIGFTEHATYRDESGRVVHAEWLWPGGGGIMFGAATDDNDKNVGRGAAYLVCADPDALAEKAAAAGATIDSPVRDQDYGGRGGGLKDPEGNGWAIGSYQPS